MAKLFSSLQKLRSEVEGLLDESQLRTGKERPPFFKFAHFWVLVARSFIKNRCPLRASALSFTTLFALVPMLAIAMSVTTSILKKEGQAQIEQFIETFVASVIPPADETAAPYSELDDPAELGIEEIPAPEPNENLQETGSAAPAASGSNGAPDDATEPAGASQSRLSKAQKEVAEQIYGFIQNIQSGAIAGIGMLFVLYAAVRLLSQLEATFNDIWGVTEGRSWWMSIMLYWTAITLGPVVLAVTLGLASGPYLETTQEFLLKVPFIGNFLFKLLPLVLLWFVFAALYKTVPHTKVTFRAAFVGGLVGGTAWHVNNLLAFLYVSRVVTYSKMYGGLGLIPVFMLGLYLSWVILLFGAQVAYAFQNRALYFQEKLAENVNQRGREFVALRLMTCLGQRFQRGQRPASVQQMSQELGIPSRLIQQVLGTLMSARLVTEVSGEEPAFTPARPLHAINAHHILMAMRATSGQELMTRDEPVREEVYGEFARIQNAEKAAASSISMLALVDRAESRLELHPPSPPEEEIRLKPALVPGRSAKPVEAAVMPGTENPEHAKTGSHPEQEAGAVSFTADPEHSKSEPAPADPTATGKPVAEPESDENRQFPL